MTFDRDEQYLHDVLQAGLPTAGADLWPAVAAALPAGQARQRRRTRAVRLAVCLGAPLLLAAGALLGRAEFTNLRENPRPSFAPENNTGYAIRYDLTAYALPEELDRDLLAAANGEPDGGFSWYTGFAANETPTLRDRGTHGYDSWQEMTADTALPLLQSDLLDSSTAYDTITLYRTTEWTPPEGMSSEEATEYLQELDRQNQYPVGFTVSWASEYPHLYPSYLRLRRVNRVAGQLGDYVIDLQAIAALSYEHVHAGTTLSNHEVWFTQQSALTWENEEYTTDLGIVALMPHCTSYQEPGYRDTYAFFTWDGIYYRLNAWSPNGWEDGMTADARAVLKQVLDSFTPPETAP